MRYALFLLLVWWGGVLAAITPALISENSCRSGRVKAPGIRSIANWANIPILANLRSSNPRAFTRLSGRNFRKLALEPSFISGMRTDTRYRRSCRKYKSGWKQMRHLFEQYRRARAKTHFRTAGYKIPKKIHMIWLGSKTPPLVWKMLDSWKWCHPGWSIKLWTDNDVRQFPLKNRQAYDRAKNWGEKSDIFRYELLEKEGGIYVDTDFECFKAFDEICKVADFFGGVGYSCGAPYLLTGIIGCRPGHPILKECVARLQVGSGDNDFQRILRATGPRFFSRCFTAAIGSEGCGIVAPFPVTYFYPFPDGIRGSYSDMALVKRDWFHPESYAIHYWNISWEDPQNIPK